MCKKKQRLYNKAKRTNKEYDWQKFKLHKKETHKQLKQAHLSYTNTILSESLESNDYKNFWKYIKTQKQEHIGVQPLKEKGVLHNDATTKANILNN